VQTAHFICEPAPDHPGWLTWDMIDERRFNTQAIGKFIVRKDDATHARVRMFPTIAHSNLMNKVHGGALLSLMDISLFAASRMFGIIDIGVAVTLDLTSQFIGGADIDVPLDSVVELLRETGRMVFLRGLLVQGDTIVAAFSGTIRKPSPPQT